MGRARIIMSLVFVIVYSVLSLTVVVSQEAQEVNKYDKDKPKYALVYVQKYINQDVTNKTGGNQGAANVKSAFKQEMDKAGKQGYKVKVGYPAKDVSLMELNEGEYGYSVFKLSSSSNFSSGDLTGMLTNLNDDGYRVIAKESLPKTCTYPSGEYDPNWENCTYHAYFLAERDDFSKANTLQTLMSVSPSWRNRTEDQLTDSVIRELRNGSYPEILLSKFEILFDKARESGDVAEDVDFQVVSTGWVGLGFQKKINKLAALGYRVYKIGDGIAIMLREKGSSPLSYKYVWLSADEKNFSKQLESFTKKGARFHSALPDQHGVRKIAVLEETNAGQPQQTDIKIFEIDFERSQDPANNISTKKLTEASERSLELINFYAENGYDVKDMIAVPVKGRSYLHKYQVILQKTSDN